MLYCTCSAQPSINIFIRTIEQKFFHSSVLFVISCIEVPKVQRENFSEEIDHMNTKYVYTLRRKNQDPSVTHNNLSTISTIKRHLFEYHLSLNEQRIKKFTI